MKRPIKFLCYKGFEI